MWIARWRRAREQYELLGMLNAVELPASLDPEFMNAQSWDSLSIKGVLEGAAVSIA